MTKPLYRSIFISDVHLGSRACQADSLCEFLKTHTCHTLYLVGDIIDFWKLKRSIYWPQSHSNVIRRLLTASKRGTHVKYVLGNHDECLREWLPEVSAVLGNIEVANSFDHITVDLKRLLVTHGDLYDGVIRYHKWLSLLGDRAYSMLLWSNTMLNLLRKAVGLQYWSFSNHIKVNTKQAVAIVTKFQEFVCSHAANQGYHGVVCGHIHSAIIKPNADFVYINTGDWCETVSAVVEHHDGVFELLVWNSEQNQMICTARWRPFE